MQLKYLYTGSKDYAKDRAYHLEIPDGPCYVFEDPSGNETAVFETTRPEHLIESYHQKLGQKPE